MKVLVCGSRHFNDFEKLCDVLDAMDAHCEITEIIEGGARGADRLAVRWANDLRIPVREFPADWDKHGKAAGPIRNSQMLREGMPDMVVAFLAPNSRGTAHMISIAEKAGVPVKVINI